jgi:fibronectin-binding autotransporter adhesin
MGHARINIPGAARRRLSLAVLACTGAVVARAASAGTYYVANGSSDPNNPIDLATPSAAGYTLITSGATGTPGANDVTLISTNNISTGTGANAFDVAANLSIGQLRVDLLTGTTVTGSVAGGSETIAAGNALILNGTGATFTPTGSVSAGGILLNSGVGASLTINANIRLAATQYFTNSRILTIGGNIDLNGNGLYVDSAQSIGVGQTTISGTIADSTGSATTGLNLYAGAGTLTLTGSNTYGGGTVLAVAGSGGGAVRVGNANALGTGGVTFAGNFTLGTAVGGSATTLSNPIAINSSSSSVGFNASVDGANADLTLAGAISGPGNLLKTTAGNVILTAANSYAGETNVSAGVLTVTAAGATLGGTAGLTTPVGNIVFGGTGANGTIAFATAANLGLASQVRFSNTGGTAGAGGDLLYVGTTVQTASVTLFSDSSLGIRLDSNSSGGSITYNGTFSQTNRPIFLGGSGTGANTLATAYAGTGAVTKTGAGKWLLSAPNTYTGATNVSAGTLVLTGSTATGSAVTVQAAGKLAGTGTVGGTATLVGTITGGTGATATDAPGVLTMGAFNLSGGTYDVKLDLAAATAAPLTSGGSTSTSSNTVSDKLIITGLVTSTVTSGTALTVTPVPISNAVPGSTYSFVIADGMTNASSGAGAFDGLFKLSSTTDARGDAFALSTASDGVAGEDLILDVTSAAAPEPTSLLLAGLAAMPLALGRTRRWPVRPL